jgi:selenide,water dikinase
VLRDLQIPGDANLLVGLSTGDDAGVYRVTENVALVQTLDFFTPIVDDPYLYGQIAAANSLSDVYAMGGRPLTAMNILCFPIHDRDPRELAEILRGGAEKVAEAGVALVGGHSVDDPEPKFGLSVTGLIDPAHIATNAGARPGDLIVLTKPLGTGIVTTAAKFDACAPEVLALACRSMAALNAGAAEAMRAAGIGPNDAIHAATDITGFALCGHLFHMAKASGVGIEIDSAAVPLLPEVERMAAAGNVTRGGKENRAYLANNLRIGPDVSPDRLSVLLDPQTSGGLAIVVRPEDADALLHALEQRNVLVHAVIGRIVASDTPTLSIR